MRVRRCVRVRVRVRACVFQGRARRLTVDASLGAAVRAAGVFTCGPDQRPMRAPQCACYMLAASVGGADHRGDAARDERERLRGAGGGARRLGRRFFELRHELLLDRRSLRRGKQQRAWRSAVPTTPSPRRSDAAPGLSLASVLCAVGCTLLASRCALKPETQRVHINADAPTHCGKYERERSRQESTGRRTVGKGC